MAHSPFLGLLLPSVYRDEKQEIGGMNYRITTVRLSLICKFRQLRGVHMHSPHPCSHVLLIKGLTVPPFCCQVSQCLALHSTNFQYFPNGLLDWYSLCNEIFLATEKQ